MKKIVAIMAVMAGFALSACSVAEGAADLKDQAGVQTTGVGNENVKLVRAKSYIHYKYGSHYERKFEIRVKNLSFNKEVGVHHKLIDGSWTNLEASYIKTAADGFEIWEVFASDYYGSDKDSEFVVFATMNGVTYWDNNSGANYSLENGDGALLGQGIGVLQNHFYFYGDTAYMFIDVKNIAYNKSVQVVYTTDNWATSGVADATYVSRYYYGYASVESPNQAGFERWEVTAPVADANNFKYFIKYTVEGQEYFDNNFGGDYTLL